MSAFTESCRKSFTRLYNGVTQRLRISMKLGERFQVGYLTRMARNLLEMLPEIIPLRLTGSHGQSCVLHILKSPVSYRMI